MSNKQKKLVEKMMKKKVDSLRTQSMQNMRVSD